MANVENSTEPKKYVNVRIMNNVTDIREQANSVNKYSMTGVSALGFPGKISPVRSLMMAKHASQRVVLDHPEFPRVFTGAENAYGHRSSYYVEAKDDLILEQKFVKFPNNPYSSILYIFKNIRTGKYTCHLAEKSEWLTEKYGFQNIDCIDKVYNVGDTIAKGVVISRTPSYDKNSNYMGGVNLRILRTTLPELTEDAIIISESAAKKLEYSMVDKVTVDIKEKTFLLNNYGTIDNYKAFPDIGEEVVNGILCSTRESSYMSSKAEALIPHMSDIKYYTHGIVTDINIYSNDPDIQDKQIQYYLNCTTQWYQAIYTYITSILQHVDQDDSKLLDIYHKAEKFLTDAQWATKEKRVFTQIEFKILQHKKIAVGQKITGRYGNKSVVSQPPVPDHLMPKTDDGRPIDVLENAFAPTNRIISFTLYEATLTFMMERLTQHLRQMKKDNKSYDDMISLVYDFIYLFSHDYAKDVLECYKYNPEKTMDDILKNGLYMMTPPFQEENTRDALLEAENRWSDIFERYTLYTKLRHRWIEQKHEKYAVGYQYMWVLKQEPSKYMSAVSTGRTTLYDLPVKTSNYKKRLREYSDNSIRFGEYDTYGFLQCVPVDDFGKLAPAYRGSQYEANSILMSHLNDIGIKPGSINQFPQMECLKAYLKAMGISLEQDFNVNTITSIDEEEKFAIGNHEVTISCSFLRTCLVIYSYYIQYEEYKNGCVDMDEFITKILTETDVFDLKSDEYKESAIMKFFELLPILREVKYLK